MTSNYFLISTALVLGTLLCGHVRGGHHGGTGNIVEVASANGFTTLVDFASKAGLADVLQTGGPFTVFAPTNDAFAKLPQSLVMELSSDTEKLKKVLLAHVVSGKTYSSDLSNGLEVTPLLETYKLIFRIGRNGAASVNGANIEPADVEASNGVIHVIDSVINPLESIPTQSPHGATKNRRDHSN